MTKFLISTAAILILAGIILGFFFVSDNDNMKAIGIIMSIMGVIWVVMEASGIIYGIYDIKRTKK